MHAPSRKWSLLAASLVLALPLNAFVPLNAFAQSAAKPRTDDRDYDGVKNAQDSCPDEPEDVDGFEDEDGCPDPDNDRDGIPDHTDRCVDQPETYNGVDDGDGCPDASRRVEPQRQAVEPPRPPPPAPAPAPTPAPAPARPARSTAAGAQEKWVVAVMNIEAPPKDKVLGGDTARGLTDQIRVFLAVRRMKVVDRGAMDNALKEMVAEEKKKSYAACVDASCQIPLGKALAATHILRSSIARFDKTCTMNGELIDLKTEVVAAAATARAPCNATELLDAAEKVADTLIHDSQGS